METPELTAVDATPSTETKDAGYESNPFLNAISGLLRILWFNAGPSMVATLALLVPVIFFYVLFIASLAAKNTALLGIFGSIFMLVIWIYLPVISGASLAIASASLKEQSISFRKSLSLGLNKWPQLVGLMIISGLMLTLGFLLLIIPGIIILARISLAGLLIFEENLGPVKAVKRSFALTKGHTFEMLGSIMAGYLLSGSYLLGFATSLAPIVGRYEGLKKLEASNVHKPKVHWLNYASVFVAFLFVVGFVAYIAFVVNAGIREVKKTNTQVATTKSNLSMGTVSVDTYSLPYCGFNPPSADMSTAALSLESALMIQASNYNTISNHIKSENLQQNAQDVQDKLAADRQLLTDLDAIQFPAADAADANAYETSVENYDTELAKELPLFPNIGNIQNALTPLGASRSQTGHKLSQDLGLSPNIDCGFYTP